MPDTEEKGTTNVTMTQREFVEAQREAFVAGWQFVALYTPDAILKVAGPESEAAARYPLPKVKSPRVVEDSSGYQWTIRNGDLCYRFRNEGAWRGGVGISFPADRPKVIADLLANPTEECEDGQ